MAENDGKIVIGVEGDASGINKTLDEVEKKGKKSAASVGDAFKAIAGAVAGAQIIGAFKSAVDQANRLEASLNRVESAARSFGQSTAKAKDAAMTLAKDGFLSLNQSASALSNLMSTGLNVDQSKKFIEAAKDISAFGNTVGDAASAVESGIKGIITGSAELVENLSPAMKTLSMRFTENKNKVGEAKAVQILYNDVLKLGTRYAGDAARYLDTAAAAQKRFEAATDAASAAIGKSLQPAVKALYSFLEGIVSKFTEFFTSLSGGAQTILALSAGLGGLSVAGLTAAKGIGLFTGSLSAALVPLGLILTALTAVALAANAFQDKFGKTRGQEMLEERKALQDIAAKQDLSISQRTRLKELNNEIAKSYDPIIKKIGAENVAFEEQLEILRAIDKERDKAKSGGAAGVAKSRAQLQETIAAQRSVLSGFGQTDYTQLTQSQAQGRIQQIAKLAEDLRKNEARLAAIDEQGAGAGAGKVSAGPGSPEFRFIEARDELRQLQKEYDAYISKVGAGSALGSEATEKLWIAQKAVTDQLRGSIAEYIEERTDAERIANESLFEQQLANIRKLVNAKAISEKEAEKKQQEAREAYARKNAQIELESYQRTLQGANLIAGGVSSIARAQNIGQATGGMGGILQGVGGLNEKWKGIGIAGQTLGVFGSIASTLTDLFGKSDAERQEEAEAQKRRDEEAKAILELQANYQKSMLALQEAQAKLPFENLSRNLRLTDINAQQQLLAGADANTVESNRLARRQSLIQGVISEQSGTIAGGQLFGNVDASPESLTRFLSERAAQSGAVSFAMSLLMAMQNTTGMTWKGAVAYIQSLMQQLDSVSGQIPPELYQAIRGPMQDVISTLTSFAQYDKYGGMNTIGSIDMSRYTGQASALASEITRDTGTAENLLGVLEQSLQTQLDIKKSTRATADNTARLTQMRETTILDLAGGGLRGFGSFFRGAFNSIDSVLNPRMPAIATPSAISNSLTIASMTRSWQERTADGIEQLVKIQTEALQLLAEIAINSNRAGDVSGSLSEAELLNIMAKVRSRLV